MGSRDGSICLYNALENYKHLTTLKPLDHVDDEVTALHYARLSSSDSFLVVGSSTGQLKAIDLSSLAVCFSEKQYLASETQGLHFDAETNKLIAINLD